MLKAKDIMEKNVITVSPDTEITQAAQILLENSINGVPVIDDQGRLKGILCQSDLIIQHKEISLPPILTILDSIIPLTSSKKLKEEIQKIGATTVSHAMAPNPVSVSKETPIAKIAEMMVAQHFHTIPVLENKKLVGIIGKEDMLKTLTQGE